MSLKTDPWARSTKTLFHQSPYSLRHIVKTNFAFLYNNTILITYSAKSNSSAIYLAIYGPQISLRFKAAWHCDYYG